jgi:hypothetical protein
MKILALLIDLQKNVRDLRRGCECGYDYRCTYCSHIIKAKETLVRLKPEERVEDLDFINALENILPDTPSTKELITQLRSLTNAEVT